MATPSSESRIFGLDLLRAMAIAAVVLSHGRHFWAAAYPGSSRLYALGIGVDVFFVLSGFLIGGILIRDLEPGATAKGLARFWARRWMRTLPNYWLFLAINLAMPAGPFPGRDTPEHLARYFVFLQNTDHLPPQFFHESWSLAIEEWFYLTVPLAAFLIAAIRPGRRSSVLVAAVGVGLLSFGAKAFEMNAPDKSLMDLHRGVVYRLDSIAVGVVAAWLAAHLPRLWGRLRGPGLVVGLSMILALIGFRLTDGVNTPAGRLLFSDACALGTACLLPALSSWRSCPGLAGRWVVRISKWSYSMYLINTPLLVLAMILTTPTATVSGSLLRWSGWLAALTFSSWLCYRSYERPLTSIRDLDWRAVPGRRNRRADLAGRVEPLDRERVRSRGIYRPEPTEFAPTGEA